VVKLRGLNIEESNDDPVEVLPVLTKFDSSRVQVSTVNGLMLKERIRSLKEQTRVLEARIGTS